MTIPLNVTRQQGKSHQLLPLSLTRGRWLCRHSWRLTGFEFCGESLQCRLDSGLPFIRLSAEAVERWKWLCADQPETNLIEVAIEDGVDVSLGNRWAAVGRRLGSDSLDHLREVVMALRCSGFETWLSTRSSFEELFERNLFTDAS
jgi:hypothetical protein